MLDPYGQVLPYQSLNPTFHGMLLLMIETLHYLELFRTLNSKLWELRYIPIRGNAGFISINPITPNPPKASVKALQPQHNLETPIPLIIKEL